MPLDILTRRRASPVKVLSTIWIFVPVFCILVYLFNRSTPYPSQSLGPENKATVYKVDWTNSISPARTAYVYTYFSGRSDDAQRFVATLTSIEALRRTNTQRDIVVMVDHLIQNEQIEQFKSHGVSVHSIPKIDLFHSKDTKILPLGEFCYSNFAPIYAWSLDEKYDRVMWLDADVLPQMNMDELFLCGEFCMTYSNLQWYTASILILKPSKGKFIELFGNLATRGVIAQKLRQFQSTWFPTITQCQDLYEEFLLQSFYQLEAAPLFNAEAGHGQQTVPMMRLNMGYCLNPIYWYEKYNWDLARAGGYEHMKSNSEYNIPGHSIGYPRVKPYDWFQAIYWNTSWVWAHWRKVLLQETFFGIATTIVSIAALWYLLTKMTISILFKLLSKSSHSNNNNNNSFDIVPVLKNHRQTHFLFKAFSTLFTVTNYIGIVPVGSIIGLLFVGVSGYIAYRLIPDYTSYYVAWPVFAIILGIFQHATLLWISALFYYALNGADAWVDSENVISNLDKTFLPNAFSSSSSSSTSTSTSSSSAQDHLPYNQSEWKLITKNAAKITSNPNMTLLLFIDEQTSSLSPLSQKQLLSAVTHWKSMLFNILLVACVYLINQYQIYPVFALKILCLFFGLLYTLIVFVKPYISLMLVMYYTYNGQFTWRKPRKPSNNVC